MIDDINKDNAFKLTRRQDDLLVAEGGRRGEPVLRPVQERLAAVLGQLGLPRDGAGLHLRHDGLPAPGPRGDRDRAGVQDDHGGPVGHGAAARSARPARPRSRWPTPAGVSPRAASTRRRRSSWSSSSPRASPRPTFAKENSLVPILKSAADDAFFKDGPWASYVTMNDDPDTYVNVTPAARRAAGGPSGAKKSDAGRAEAARRARCPASRAAEELGRVLDREVRRGKGLIRGP